MPISLIVNADDFGYFHSVSRGILECVDNGVVTATAVMANSPIFETCAGWLRERHDLDIGVHLTLSFGEPLTRALKAGFAFRGGGFPPRFTTVRHMLLRRLKVHEVVDECRAQIERCLDNGLTIRFVNSHEHIHMLPALWPRLQTLAEEYGISHVRFAGPEWNHGRVSQGFVRNLLLQGMALTARPRNGWSRIPCLGTRISGRLSDDYLLRTMPKLEPGRVYELMCHPGHFDAAEITDQRLCEFHDWEGEVNCLQGERFRQLCERHHVQCIRYRDLTDEATAAEGGSTA